MNPLKVKSRVGPEAIIQAAIVKELRFREWFVKETHGNMFQSGFPDLYAAHPRRGTRWIEVKNPLAYSFTKAQMEDFPRFAAAGVGIWILVAPTQEELDKLDKPANWHTYLSIWKS